MNVNGIEDIKGYSAVIIFVNDIEDASVPNYQIWISLLKSVTLLKCILIFII